MKTYLKYEKFGVEFSVFDSEKLTKIRLYLSKECEISYFDNEYDLQESIKIEINNGAYIVNEKGFKKEIKKFKEELNLILCD